MIRPPVERINYGLPTLNAATTAQGLCGPCAAHWWLHSVDNIRWVLLQGGTAVLQIPAVQGALGRIMAHMHPELGALDWARMLAQWELPWPSDWALPADAQWNAATNAPA